MVTSLEARTEERSMARGRRPKPVAQPKLSERMEALSAALDSLSNDLKSGGFEAMLPHPNAVKLTTKELKDSRTGGRIGHVEEPLGVFLQRLSVNNNFSQRPPFDHANDKIYRRLIRDFITGAVMPESRIAALRNMQGEKLQSLGEPNIYYSIIDGLQRQYCYGLALLLVWRRRNLVDEKLITEEAWEYFREPVQETGDIKTAIEALLARTMRYEIFYDIDLEGLLHYMVTFNTGQRQMNLKVQLEIMSGPLIKELGNLGISIFNTRESHPGIRKPGEQFAASDLVLACEAFLTANCQVAASEKAEGFLDEGKGYLDDVGDIADVGKTLKRITTELHPEIARVYANDSTKRNILSDRATFLQSLAAACGYIRNRQSMKALDGALDKLMEEVRKPTDDPLGLADYFTALETITTSRGKAMRRLVHDTFLRFFAGATLKLEWEDTARQITG